MVDITTPHETRSPGHKGAGAQASESRTAKRENVTYAVSLLRGENSKAIQHRTSRFTVVDVKV